MRRPVYVLCGLLLASMVSAAEPQAPANVYQTMGAPPNPKTPAVWNRYQIGRAHV